MKTSIILITTAALLTGCKTAKQAQQPLPVVPIKTKTDTRIIHTERIDTVFIEIPAQSAERTTADKISHLETAYAESDARINEDGTLSHTLKNKSAPKPVPVKNATDTVFVNKTIEKPVPVEVLREVERRMTRWEKTRLDTWGWIMAALVACIAWISRRPLTSLARRLLK